MTTPSTSTTSPPPSLSPPSTSKTLPPLSLSPFTLRPISLSPAISSRRLPIEFLSIFDADPFVLLKSVNAHEKGDNDLTVHPSGKLALSVGRNKYLAMVNLEKIGVHQAEDAKLLCELEGNKRVLCAATGENGVLLTGVLTKNDGGGDADDPYLVASAFSDGVRRVWDVRMAIKEKPISLAEAKTNSRLICLAGSSIKCDVRSPIVKVTDPEETDLFFIPVFSLLSLIMNSGDGPVPEGGARQCSDNEMQEELVEWLEKQEYWRRNNRLDHVIMAGDPNAMLRVVDG
ncbi:hypothetical protein Pint_12275 [Pistacia integerrima]|uniref:Uncharacterized protein n=1 Tax=Pistacia integerrima TaxID=434235 RepID=A0ACC0XJL9_9ROSI|nr:hypothetical protein Pint_12275 [Pistacia integerrima]